MLPKFPDCFQKANVGFRETEDNEILFPSSKLCHVLGVILAYVVKWEQLHLPSRGQPALGFKVKPCLLVVNNLHAWKIK